MAHYASVHNGSTCICEISLGVEQEFKRACKAVCGEESRKRLNRSECVNSIDVISFWSGRPSFCDNRSTCVSSNPYQAPFSHDHTNQFISCWCFEHLTGSIFGVIGQICTHLFVIGIWPICKALRLLHADVSNNGDAFRSHIFR